MLISYLQPLFVVFTHLKVHGFEACPNKAPHNFSTPCKSDASLPLSLGDFSDDIIDAISICTCFSQG